MLTSFYNDVVFFVSEWRRLLQRGKVPHNSQTPKTRASTEDYDTELPTDQAMIIDYAHTIGIIVHLQDPPEPQVSPCYFLQLCIADIRKYIIMPTGETHTLNYIAPYMEVTLRCKNSSKDRHTLKNDLTQW
ncbi:hypothetical protein TNIN_134741 [Trichonephila inaurata madagascariensis]|uniref:Uncharacterized protein n=1 Tax=Trichonephila inaurata madagascariensis TaxID=2747483 RepID=A0A8X6Y6K0_9ARAC|nr:hypothetical protein TNIN_134741 [Trichonephila inaurata madagascariensis]